jgi:hypothetical protein
MVHVLFTYSNKWGSKLIRSILQEPVSHVAILDNGYVTHSTLDKGVHVLPLAKFREHNIVLWAVAIPSVDREYLLAQLTKSYGAKYDWKAFIFLGLRRLAMSLLPKKWHAKIPKVNLWQASNMFICTELVQQLSGVPLDALMTPKQLFHVVRRLEK